MSQGKVYFNPAEEQWILYLKDMGMTHIQACEVVIHYKRDQALMHKMQGNVALWEHLLKEIGEWDESLRDVDVPSMPDKNRKIILPDD